MIRINLRDPDKPYFLKNEQRFVAIPEKAETALI
jgi:hypothetical protein